MFKTLQNALKIKELRGRLIFTFLMLLVIRFGSQLPVPGVDPDYFADFFNGSNGDAFNLFNAMTGGSFENFSILALSISPYITSSIIIQLLTIAIPKLEELQQDGQEGRKKIAEITRYVTVGLALIQSTAMSIGFGRSGMFEHYTWYNVVVCVITLTAGSAFLMWVGERITEKGVGNGISVVLLYNIISRLPDDAITIYETFMSGRSIAVQILIAVFVIAILLAILGFTVLLNAAERRIPVQYAQKVQGRRSVGGRSTYIPVKVNTANVMPVIFASSLMSMPQIIGSFFGYQIDVTTISGKIMAMLSSNYWFRPSLPFYSIGVVVYVALLIVFAYFYTSISFNPLEIADNMKKSGGFIPGVRPGKPTSDFLNNMLNHLIIIGAVGLTIIALLPIILSGIFNITRLSFMGTSLIIIVSVVLETAKSIESKMVAREYESLF